MTGCYDDGDDDEENNDNGFSFSCSSGNRQLYPFATEVKYKLERKTMKSAFFVSHIFRRLQEQEMK